MKYFLIIISLLGGLIQAQCDDLLESQCTSSSDCEWIITDTENYNCANFGNQSNCENYSDYGCSWEFSWGGWQNYGSSCVGGSFSVISGICESIEILECSEMNESECSNDGGCEWIEDIEIINCSTLSTSGWGPGSCEYYYPDCYNYLDYGGWYGSWTTECGGGTAQIDNSYCEEVSFIPGDMNDDGSLNISDIVIMVDLILNLEFYDYSDMNQDGILNIMDIIELVNRILDN